MGSDTDHLLNFLRDHDAPCPLCGYNLRNLIVPTCPECHHGLKLTVGIDGVRIGWYIAALSPFLFSGMAALALGSLLVVAELAGGRPPPILHLLTLVGLCSGSVAAALIWRRRRFLRFEPATQRRWAIIAWVTHLLPFLGIIILMLATI